MKSIVCSISPSNDALVFIDKRIADNNYRGSWSSQHNRYTMDDVVKILKLLDKYAPNGVLITIRNTDISKRPHNTREEATYAQFCDEAKQITGIGTQDAMRKNLFVDFHRMGFINRYNRNRECVVPLVHSNIKYISLSKQGLKLIRENNIENQYFIYSKGVDSLLKGYINLLLEILRNSDYGIDHVTIYEFMFFVSAIHTNTTFNITTQECVEYIKIYRTLSTVQKRNVIDALKTQMVPSNYDGTKTDKRDFHNWWNKAQQVFSILTQTIYFEQREEKLVLKIIKGSDNDIKSQKKLHRSIDEKCRYFRKHNVKKALGFELHHVVPLSWSENVHQFKLLDHWENMVYIDAFSHAKITQNNNRNVEMKTENSTIILSDYSGNTVVLDIIANVLYLPSNLPEMVSYNINLRNMYET
jgi:hypothetical protein